MELLGSSQEKPPLPHRGCPFRPAEAVSQTGSTMSLELVPWHVAYCRWPPPFPLLPSSDRQPGWLGVMACNSQTTGRRWVNLFICFFLSQKVQNKLPDVGADGETHEEPEGKHMYLITSGTASSELSVAQGLEPGPCFCSLFGG